MSQEINETQCNAPIDIEDEVRLLLGGDLLHLPGVVKHRGVREILFCKVADEGDSLVRVIDALHSVANSHNEFPLLFHLVNKIMNGMNAHKMLL